MKITIVTMSMMRLLQGKYYNAQDIGLARALKDLDNEVEVVNFISQSELSEAITEEIEEGLLLRKIPSKSRGVHSMYRSDFLSPETECVICFSDNQMNFSYVRKLCKKRGIKLIPYIGVIGSNNASKIKTIIMNLLANNVGMYKKMQVLSKTPHVKKELEAAGVKNVTLAPVCLNESILCKDYEKYPVAQIREELEKKHDRELKEEVYLFIGRLLPEKQPLELLDIFANLLKIKKNATLLMIGNGILENEVLKKIQELEISDSVILLDRVENNQMWKYFRISKALINLNMHEIFGMAILEAMYYGIRVVAVKAPGPEYIMSEVDNTAGFLCEDFKEVSKVLEELDTREFDAIKAHKHIENNFMWNVTAKKIMELIR